MARAPAYSDKEIIEASIVVAAKGSPITPYTIMGHLGGGSLPYMKKALSRLVSDGKIKTAEGIPSEHEQVIQDVIKLLDKQRADSRLEAFTEYQKTRAQLESTIDDLKAKLAAANSRNSELDKLLNNTKTAAAKLESDLKVTKESEHNLMIDLAKSEERIAATTNALTKAEQQAEHNQDRLQEAYKQHQLERRELLDRISTITVEARLENKATTKQLDASRTAEESLRKQLEMAMKDGLAHTKDIAGLRNQLRPLEGGKPLLKKYGTWDRITELCKYGLAKDKK